MNMELEKSKRLVNDELTKEKMFRSYENQNDYDGSNKKKKVIKTKREGKGKDRKEIKYVCAYFNPQAL